MVGVDIVKVWKSGKWIVAPVKNVKPGDIVRVFINNKPHMIDGYIVFRCTENRENDEGAIFVGFLGIV